MERLTEYDEFGNADLVGINNRKLYERLVCDETVTLTIAINKLREFEDFMEMCGYDSVETMAGDIGYMKGRIESQVTEIIDLKEHTYDLNNKLLNLQLFLKDLRDSFHKGDETYEEIDKKLKELGGVDERNTN